MLIDIVYKKSKEFLKRERADCILKKRRLSAFCDRATKY